MCVGTPSVGQAGLVLGQPNFTTTTNPYTTQSGFRNPTMVASDGNILVVSDTDNNRVLIWNSIPNVPDQPADIVLGQTNFTTVQEPPAARTAGDARCASRCVEGTQLYVADTQNHRVLIWNSLPTSNNQPADLVLGEPNFSTAPPRHYQRSSSLPRAICFRRCRLPRMETHLFVTDLGHNRVLDGTRSRRRTGKRRTWW